MRSGHLVFGVGLVVMGYAVLVIALAEQAQRAAAAASTQAAAIESAVPAAPALAPTSAAAPVQPAAIPSAQAGTQAPSAAPPSSAGAAEPSVEGEGQRMFKFSPGGAVMSREEVQRLMGFGKVLARRPLIKLSIEGFGDQPGLEPLMAGIAKHRAKVAQTLLAKAGVSEDRVTISVVDMGSDQRLARSIRVTTTPPLSEVEKP